MNQAQLTNKLLKGIDSMLEIPSDLAIHTLEATRKFSGQTRINHRMAIGEPDTTVEYAPTYVADAFVDTIQTKRAEFKAFVKQIKAGDTVHVTNSLDYSIYVEHKHGDKMYRKAVQIFPYISKAKWAI